MDRPLEQSYLPKQQFLIARKLLGDAITVRRHLRAIDSDHGFSSSATENLRHLMTACEMGRRVCENLKELKDWVSFHERAEVRALSLPLIDASKIAEHLWQRVCELGEYVDWQAERDEPIRIELLEESLTSADDFVRHLTTVIDTQKHH